ncbi:MAG: formylglycine-generating enzyme family protein [Byssovorax sp.]
MNRLARPCLIASIASIALLLAGCASSPAPPQAARATDACGGTVGPNEICVPPPIAATAVAAEAPAPEQPSLARMVRIPTGVFQMGSEDGESDEQPVHAVTVPSFEIDLTEVTVGAYRDCVAKKACPKIEIGVRWAGVSEDVEGVHRGFCNGNRDDRLDHPMNCVTWNEADTYCRSVDKRLPTEEEWEYAARGRTGAHYPWGDRERGPELLNGCGEECLALGRQHHEEWNASYDGRDGFPTTAPVGSFPSGKSPFGVLDMAGNVWEWTASPHCEYGTQSCNQGQRISRGGGWSGDPAYASNHRTTYRGYGNPEERSDSLGFRCAR